MMIDRNGPKCVCGNIGCLEAVASGNAIANRAIAAIRSGQSTSLASLLETKRIEAKDVFLAAAEKDELAVQIVHEAADYLGTALALVINLLDPETIVLEGGLSRAGDAFIDHIRRVAQRYQMKYAGRNTSIVVSELGEDSAAIGSATLILKRFFEVGGDPSAL